VLIAFIKARIENATSAPVATTTIDIYVRVALNGTEM